MFNKEEALLFELDKNNLTLKVFQKDNKDNFLSIKLYKSDRKNLLDCIKQNPFKNCAGDVVRKVFGIKQKILLLKIFIYHMRF